MKARQRRAARYARGRAAFSVAAMLLLGAAAEASDRSLRVDPAGPFPTIAAALAAAAAGDTVVVGPGLYRERLVISRPVVLRGEGWPVLDGGGRGHVIEAHAPLTLEGFVVRRSGRGVVGEDAGLAAIGAPVRIVGNRFEDVLYGVWLKAAPGSVVRNNRIEGARLPLPRRGDGIRLWESDDTRIEGNHVVAGRDVVLYFSDRVLVRGNRIEGGRYALHTMSSHDLSIEENVVLGNEVGVYVMFSHGVVVRSNVFAGAHGSTGIGLGLKDADGVRAIDNLVAGNSVGIWLDNSPSQRGAAPEPARSNRIESNVLTGNGVAVRMLPAVRGNRFTGNDLTGSRRAVEVMGGAGPGQAAGNVWRGNHWPGYAGFDRDGDGAGDTPHVEARWSEAVMDRWPGLRLYVGSPALTGLDQAARIVPALAPAPVAVDSSPAREAWGETRWRGRLTEVAGARPQGSRAAALGWLGLALLAGFALRAGGRP